MVIFYLMLKLFVKNKRRSKIRDPTKKSPRIGTKKSKMLSASDHLLKLPTHLWVDYILPTLPLKTVVTITTSLNKNSREEFSKHREDIWEKFIEEQHPYLKAITTACSYFGEEEGDLSWFDYIRYCQDLSMGIECYEFHGEIKGLREGYRFAYNIGRSHYILFNDDMKNQSLALVNLEMNMDMLIPRDAKYFSDLPSGRVKHQDIFNSLIVFLNMFNPAFASLYMDIRKILKTSIKTIRSLINLHEFIKTEDKVKYVMQFITDRFNCGYMNSEFGELQSFETERHCSALRYFVRFEEISTSRQLHDAFIVVCEFLNEMGYPIDIHSTHGSLNKEDELEYGFTFSLVEDKTVFYHIGMDDLGFYENKYSLNDKKRPAWFQDGYFWDDESEERVCRLERYLYPGNQFKLFFPYQEEEKNLFEEYFMRRGQKRILDFVKKNQLGALSFPPNILDHNLYINFEELHPLYLGKFVNTSMGIAVVLGYDEEERTFYCLSMVNKIFTEHEDDIITNVKFSKMEITGLQGIFKYQTQIGRFFTSFKNGKYIGFKC